MLSIHALTPASGLVACVVVMLSSAPVSAATEGNAFGEWLQGFRTDAVKEGVSTQTLDKILPGIRQVPRAIKQDRHQPEFKQTYAQYLGKRISPWKIKTGRKILDQEGATLSKVTREYGVQPRFVLAILGMEQNYGTFPLKYSSFDVLATLAFDSRRAARFRKELMAALKIVDQGLAQPEQLKSSWAGAIGQPQFMPSTYLRFAEDYDQDGRRDIWTAGPDLYASVAKYLKKYEWQDDQTWGRKVEIPLDIQARLANNAPSQTPKVAKYCQRYKDLNNWRSLSDWQALGVRREGGLALPTRADISAALIIDEGQHGYLVYRNFCSIMRYNPAFKYALSIGLLSDNFVGYEK